MGTKLIRSIVCLFAVLAVGIGVTMAVNAGATSPSTTYYACLSGGSLSRVGKTQPDCTTKNA